MQTILGIVVQIFNIHESCLADIGTTKIQESTIVCNNSLNTCRKGTVPSGQGFIEREVSLSLVPGEAMILQKHTKHCIGLLDDLVSVDYQRMVVEKHGMAYLSSLLGIPRFLVEEIVILHMNTPFSVIGDIHLLCCTGKETQLFITYGKFFNQMAP